jgi:benzoate-CoA ligase
MSAVAATGSTLNIADKILSSALANGFGEQPAVVWDQRNYSYNQLAKLVDCFGSALRAKGVERQDRVLCLLTDSPVLVSVYLGAIKIGAVAVAYNIRASREDLRHAIEDTACKVLLVDDQFYHLYEAIRDELKHHPTVVVVGEDVPDALSINQLLDGQAGNIEAVPTAPDDMAFWVYTSGTTGKPKAVVHTHQSVVGAADYMRDSLGIDAGQRVFATSKLFFAYALTHSLFGALSVGATMIIYDAWPDALVIADVVEREKPDVLLSVPTFYRNLLHAGAAKKPVFKSIQNYFCAGEKLPVVLNQRWQEATGKPVMEGIGTSETLFQFFLNRPGVARLGSCGKPIANVVWQLRDGEGNVIETVDVEGELWLQMPSLFTGYWQRDDATERAIQHGWYRTGDRFVFDRDGWWYHRGRSDDLLKVSGQFVSPTEVEECAEQLEEVFESALVGHPNEDGLVRTVLFIVTKLPGEQHKEIKAKLKEHLLNQLSAYKCPQQVRFIDEIPRTQTRKKQRYKLRDLLTTTAA